MLYRGQHGDRASMFHAFPLCHAILLASPFTRFLHHRYLSAASTASSRKGLQLCLISLFVVLKPPKSARQLLHDSSTSFPKAMCRGIERPALMAEDAGQGRCPRKYMREMRKPSQLAQSRATMTMPTMQRTSHRVLLCSPGECGSGTVFVVFVAYIQNRR